MTLPAGFRLGPYEILSPLGAGGMGEVYRARDGKLDRVVAIKVLPQSVADDPQALRRFEREAKAVAALSHPNILAIHDFGIDGGTAYAVTELLEGETLRAKLQSGPLSPKQALEYALQIAKGLAAAHDRGIIHRDLKPENLFVDREGHLKILDFGLAKREEQIGLEDETNVPTRPALTKRGTILGTIGYMSPEQVRGLPVDHRSDIFSFGAVLYELLSGTRAFQKDTAAETMAAILRDEPEDLSAPGPPIPAGIDRVVRHCLEKDPAHRFQSARDIAFSVSELLASAAARHPHGIAPKTGKGRHLLSAAVVASLAIGSFCLVRELPRRSHEPGGVKRVAVLPFENVGDPADDYFADGIADEIRGKLTALPGIDVIARGSSTPYKKTTKTPQEIARELDVTYLLTATVQWQKAAGVSRVQVRPELVEVKASGAPASKWQQPFEAALTDLFQVQSDIAARVAQALDVELGGGSEERLTEKPTQNLAAYDAFLKGQDIWKSLAVGDPEPLREALRYYEQAVANDPGFAQAWARIAWGNAALYSNTVPTAELGARAREAAEKAIALAPNRPDGYHALGNYRRLVLRDPTGALEQYDMGRRIAPGNADLLTATALAEESLGRWNEALEHLQQAERLDPRSVSTRLRVGEVLLWLRRSAEARDAFDGGLAIAPANLSLLEFKAMTWLAEGDLAAARSVLDAAPKEVDPTALVAFVANVNDLVWVLDGSQRELLLRLTPNAFNDDRAAWAISLLGASALKGDEAGVRSYAQEARTALAEQMRAAPEQFQRHLYMGLALAYLGHKQDAIREGEDALALASKDAGLVASSRYLLAIIYARVGERARALDTLEPLLKVPCYVSPGWLRIDPNLDSLRKEPRFQKLVSGAA